MPTRVLGICGSLRAESHNAKVLRLAGGLLPAGLELETLDWRQVPPFDADLLAASGFPDAVHAVREKIRQADALLFVTPEYNFSLPGMLKNMIDWVSRGDDQPFKGKPVAIVSAATGPLGGARVQYELRKVLQCLEAPVLPKPEVFIGMAAQKFDREGRCTDEPTVRFLRAQLEAFARWTALGPHS